MGQVLMNEEEIKERFLYFTTKMKKENEGRINEMATPELVSCEPASQTITFRFKFHEWMENTRRVMHGGLVCVIMDCALGYASWILQGKTQTTMPTVSLDVQFVNPVKREEYVYIRAKVHDVKSRLTFASGVMYLASQPEQTCASGIGQYYCLDPGK